VKVIAFFVRLFSAGSELGLNQKFNRKSTEKLQNCFLVFLVFGFWFGWTEFWTGNHPNKWKMTPTAIFGFLYKRGFFPNGFLGFLVCS
jgi:hypothetical protein